MSTALAIASVSHVLKDLLNNGLIDHDVTGAIGGNVNVTALPPDRIDAAPGAPQSQLNLFMYQATPNQGWRNMGLPSRNQSGERLTNPPLALDLHYLMSAYGTNELHAEILLGYGMQLLHETPVLVRDAIRRALAPPLSVSGGNLPPELQALSTSELAEQVEQVKITPETLNMEEISKLWTAFQAKYRPTAAYLATVVLIEGRKSTRPALPVRARKFYVIPFRQPVIETLKSQVQPGDPVIENQPILAGYNLVIIGNHMKGEDVHVNIGGIEVTPTAENMSDRQIMVALPAGLQTGIQGVQVVHRILMGSPPEAHRGVESNMAAFVLSPQIIAAVNISNVQDSGDNTRSADLTITVNPAVGPKQRVVLLLNEFSPGPSSPPVTAPLLSYGFEAPPLALLSPPAPAEHVMIPITGVRVGTYLVRVQIDGAESPLGTDLSGRYNSPLVSIP